MSNTRNRNALARRVGLAFALLLTLVTAGPVRAGDVHSLPTADVITKIFQMPACPIRAHTVPPTKTQFLPPLNPLADNVSIAGTIQVTDQTGSTVLLIAPVVTANQAQLSFSRTIKTLQHATGQVTFDKGCTKTDPYGSNNCRWDWGQTVTEAHQGALQEDITAGKLIVDLKIDTMTPLQFACPICGAPCTVSFTRWFNRSRWEGALSLTMNLLHDYPGLDWWIENQ